LLRTWTTISARLMAGLSAGPLGPVSGPYDAPPDDTGEAQELGAAGLTVTIGFGRSLFTGRTDAPGDRFGIADRLPEALVELPRFPGDDLDARAGETALDEELPGGVEDAEPRYPRLLVAK
jgi:deferrochelatase/peroxidase EfeB